MRVDIDPGRHHFPMRRSCTCMQEFMIRGDRILPECRWLHEPQPISNQPADQQSASGVGVSTPCWEASTEGSPASSAHCCCTCMEAFLTRGWDPLFFPGCRWLHKPQPTSDQAMGLGFPHRAGRYRPGGSPLSSPVCWSCKCVEGF